jgi:steroid 5-alpha reductase family enzyme
MMIAAIATHVLALPVLAAAAVLLWLLSLRLRDASIVDIAWGPMFLLIAVVHGALADDMHTRGAVVIVLAALWSLRLAGYLLWRNWGQGEDVRYQRIRRNNDPGFWWKSVYIVFGLQAGLAWVVALPFAVAIPTEQPMGVWMGLGVALWFGGFVCESVGDLQLAAFKADPANAGRVMDQGIWRYTRHPNYFGDFCVWWGLCLIAVAHGAHFLTMISPLLMSVLLMRVSGVTLLERTMSQKPEFAEYARRTSSFFPWPPASAG